VPARVAAIYDIHGNIPALEAVLAEIDREGVDLVVIGGDVTSGANSREALDRLMALADRAVWIRGNCERELVAAFDREPGYEPKTDIERGTAWEAATIERRHRDVLASLPTSVTVQIDGVGNVLFCHGSPHSDDEMLTSITSEERLTRILSGVHADVVVCGHTHVQFDRAALGMRVVNAGSVGLAYGEPGAHWSLFGPGVELRRTAYDREAAVSSARASAHPLTGMLVEMLENPPTAEAASQYFEEAAVKLEATSR